MCGIIAYVGNNDPLPVLLNGLRRLEYRGYDSVGLAYLSKESDICVFKQEGKVVALEKALAAKVHDPLSIGIGHTRWATHGSPSTVNAHPHLSPSKRLAIVHNGIIENYHTLKQQLLEEGHVFQSETDTEVLIILIESIWQKHSISLEKAVRLATTRIIGTYAFAILCQDHPQKLIAARRGGPLVLGVSKEENYYLASDATPVVGQADKVIYLQDGDLACIEKGNLSIEDLTSAQSRVPNLEDLDIHLEPVEKDGYPHFMLKEIHTQPEALTDCMRGRIDAKAGKVKLGGLNNHLEVLTHAKRIIIIGCGTSWHAGLIGEYLIEGLCRIPVEVEYASEFRYRNPIIHPGDVVLAISQSGETADTLAAIELAKQQKATIIGLVNVVGSSIARHTDAGVYLHAGPEIGVASTKAFTTQITTLLMIALAVAKIRNSIPTKTYEKLLHGLEALPNHIRKILGQSEHIKQLATLFQTKRNALYLGRGLHFPVALEGALKLKEISYIHAEGYPAAEMKHGPIALIDEHMPVIFLATQDSSYSKIISNIQEVKARKGEVISIVTERESQIKSISDNIIEIPYVEAQLMPVLSVIPLQLLAYHTAILRGCDVDQPRNLAKSVTVE